MRCQKERRLSRAVKFSRSRCNFAGKRSKYFAPICSSAAYEMVYIAVKKLWKIETKIVCFITYLLEREKSNFLLTVYDIFSQNCARHIHIYRQNIRRLGRASTAFRLCVYISRRRRETERKPYRLLYGYRRLIYERCYTHIHIYISTYFLLWHRHACVCDSECIPWMLKWVRLIPTRRVWWQFWYIGCTLPLRGIYRVNRSRIIGWMQREKNEEYLRYLLFMMLLLNMLLI